MFRFFSERFWLKPTNFNLSICACAIAFAAEMTLFLISAHFAIRAKADAHVRLENEEVDALLQGKYKSNLRKIHCNFRHSLRELNEPQLSRASPAANACAKRLATCLAKQPYPIAT